MGKLLILYIPVYSNVVKEYLLKIFSKKSWLAFEGMWSVHFLSGGGADDDEEEARERRRRAREERRKMRETEEGDSTDVINTNRYSDCKMVDKHLSFPTLHKNEGGDII